MRLWWLLLLFSAGDAAAQFGIGITVPVGRSTHRLGSVPDSLAVYARKGLDLQPRCTMREDAWLTQLLRSDSCSAFPLEASCRNEQSVTLRFTVERDGSISDLLVVKSGCPSLEARLRCATDQAPHWESGRIGHQKVRSRVQLRAILFLP